MNELRRNRATLKELADRKDYTERGFARKNGANHAMYGAKTMKVMKLFSRFHTDESGAVTVDWVVLTAAVCGLVGLAMAGLQGNMTSIGQKVEDHLTGATISTTF